MRILLNLLNFRPGRIGGTETYLRELIAHVPQVTRDEEVLLLTSREVAGEFRDSSLEVVAAPHSLTRIAGLRFLEAGLSPFRARGIERLIAQARPDVVLYPQQSMFPARVDCPAVVIIHDLYHLTIPGYCSRFQTWFRNRSYPAAVARADRVIAVSEVTRRSVVEHYGCDRRKIAVVPHGIRQLDPVRVQPSRLVDVPYVYYPAVTQPHKNHELLFRTVARLKAQSRFPYRLILTGAQTGHWAHLEQVLRDLSLEDVVTHLGYVPYATVLELIRGAASLVFPSRCEGFGIPVIEAAMLERKMITSQLEVFEEIGVPADYRIDFADSDALARALDNPASASLLRPPSTWQECARATLDVLCAAAGQRTAPPPVFQLAPHARRYRAVRPV